MIVSRNETAEIPHPLTLETYTYLLLMFNDGD